MKTNLQIVSCIPGIEERLLRELRRTYSHSRHRILQPGWCESVLTDSDCQKIPALCFQSQVFANAVPVNASSVNEWARTTFDLAADSLKYHHFPWRFHVVSIPHAGGNAGIRRCELIRSAVLEILKRKQKRLLKTLNSEDMPNWQENEAFLQVALLTATSGFVSFADQNCHFRLRRILSPHRNGHVSIEQTALPPSRAYLKLIEAEQVFGFTIHKNDSCVDLAASPGGWTWVLLSRGAKVTAIDRAPLRSDLMKHPLLTFHKGDAFKFRPEKPVDWLLCDIIAFPERTLSLLETWLKDKLCKCFCVTIKFRGEEFDQVLEDLKRMLELRTTDFAIRKLENNKNEVTAFGML